jgi:long-chain acyl-CoA synthetase
MSDLNKFALDSKFNSLEKIKQLHLTLDPMTVENDLLTPTMKIKRNIAKKHYEKIIEELYKKPIVSA